MPFPNTPSALQRQRQRTKLGHIMRMKKVCFDIPLLVVISCVTVGMRVLLELNQVSGRLGVGVSNPLDEGLFGKKKQGL